MGYRPEVCLFIARACVIALCALTPARAAAPSATRDWTPVLQALRAPDPAAREAAAKELVAAGPEAVPAIVADMVRSRRQALGFSLLGKIGTPAVSPLIGLLKDPDLRNGAGSALAQIRWAGLDAHADELIGCLEDQAVQHYCGQALVGAMSPKSAVLTERLAKLAGGSDPVIRGYAIAALGQIGPKAAAAVPVLTEALKSREPSVRWAAATALGKLGKAALSARPALKAASESDPDPDMKRLAKEALKRVR